MPPQSRSPTNRMTSYAPVSHPFSASPSQASPSEIEHSPSSLSSHNISCHFASSTALQPGLTTEFHETAVQARPGPGAYTTEQNTHPQFHVKSSSIALAQSKKVCRSRGAVELHACASMLRHFLRDFYTAVHAPNLHIRNPTTWCATLHRMFAWCRRAWLQQNHTAKRPQIMLVQTIPAGYDINELRLQAMLALSPQAAAPYRRRDMALVCDYFENQYVQCVVLTVASQ